MPDNLMYRVLQQTWLPLDVSSLLRGRDSRHRCAASQLRIQVSNARPPGGSYTEISWVLRIRAYTCVLLHAHTSGDAFYTYARACAHAPQQRVIAMRAACVRMCTRTHERGHSHTADTCALGYTTNDERVCTAYMCPANVCLQGVTPKMLK
jgi:hypothetical protein